MSILEVKVVVYVTDDGDGSQYVQIFNDLDELEKELSRRGLTLKEVLSEDDPYKNGVVASNRTLTVDTTTGKLTKPFCFITG